MSIQSESSERGSALSRLAGARLTSVQFVLNYLILGFDERGALTTLVWPGIRETNGKTTLFGAEGYRDKLCSLIETTVKSVTMSQNEEILIAFDNEITIEIPLRSYEGHGERAILTGPKHYLFIF